MVRSFALGGEGGTTDADAKVRYRSTLQNYLIDTGSEVILVDTGMPLEAPDMVPEDDSPIYIGSRIKDYVCSACGFEYVGDLDAEPDDYVCPLCGMPKKVFRKKETE